MNAPRAQTLAEAALRRGGRFVWWRPQRRRQRFKAWPAAGWPAQGTVGATGPLAVTVPPASVGTRPLPEASRTASAPALL